MKDNKTYPDVFVTEAGKVPLGPHYALFISGTHLSPGYDEGDPCYAEKHIEYYAFLSREGMQAYLDNHPNDIGKMTAAYVNATKIEIQVNVNAKV